MTSATIRIGHAPPAPPAPPRVTAFRIGAGPPAPPQARARRSRRLLLAVVRVAAWLPLLLFVALVFAGFLW